MFISFGVDLSLTSLILHLSVIDQKCEVCLAARSISTGT